MHRSALLLLLSAQVALATGQPVPDAEPRLASKEEYALCLGQEDELKRSQAGLTQRQDELKQLLAKFKTADDKLQAQVRQHAPSNKAEIQSYNRAVEWRNQNVKAFNERTRALEREQSQVNAKVLEHNNKCGSLAVPADIKDAVDQERKNRGGER